MLGDRLYPPKGLRNERDWCFLHWFLRGTLLLYLTFWNTHAIITEPWEPRPAEVLGNCRRHVPICDIGNTALLLLVLVLLRPGSCILLPTPFVCILRLAVVFLMFSSQPLNSNTVICLLCCLATDLGFPSCGRTAKSWVALP